MAKSLARDGYGVKNDELATALNFSKPSAYNTLRSLAKMGIVRQETFGLAHFTDKGRTLTKKHQACFALLERKMSAIYGIGTASEKAICGILADMSLEKTDELYNNKAT